MRSAQTRYFRTRDRQVMANSKTLEQEMDAEIIHACLRDPTMLDFVRIEYPELLPAIKKEKERQATPSSDLFGNTLNNQ